MPKKPAKNAFFFFMKELEPQLRREGRVFPNGMQDVVPIAHPRWKQLPDKEKARFENMAKQVKAQMRGRAGDAYKMDSLGNIIAHRKDPYTELEKRRMAERKDMKKDWPKGKELKSVPFYFINFQSLCRTDEGDFLPAEIGLIEYSIEKGITKHLHRFIDPGQLPAGYRFICIDNSKNSHQIPVENFELADCNYLGLWNQIINFINPQEELAEYPPLYCLSAGDAHVSVEYCLEWIYHRSRVPQPNKIRRIYEIEGLFQGLHAHIGNIVSKTLLIDKLTSSDWDYERNTKCDFHEENEAKDCALAICRRYAFAISDGICQFYDVELTDKHIPVHTDTGTITVLSKFDMPVCNRQEARLPPPGQNFYHQTGHTKSRPVKPEPVQEDYSQLRRPVFPASACSLPSAPAWGGAPTTGAAGRDINTRDMVDPERHAGRAVAPPAMQAPTPPTNWQQAPGMVQQQSLGIGRGLATQLPPPSSASSQYSDDESQMVPLRLPGQTALNSMYGQTAPIHHHSSGQQFVDATPTSDRASSKGDGDKFLGVPGVGRGGILEKVMVNGRKPGVPIGRGYAPPGWVDDGSILPART